MSSPDAFGSNSITPPESATEAPSNEQVANILKQKGPEDPEAQKILLAWTIHQERLVDEALPAERPAKHIDFELRRARVYLTGGLVDEALKAMKDAQDLAKGYGFTEMYEEIDSKLIRTFKRD